MNELVAYLQSQGKLPEGLETASGSVARVTSAAALTKDEEKRLTAALAKLTGSEVTVRVSVDENLIAGFRIEVGEWVIDTSTRSQLEKMAQLMKE